MALQCTQAGMNNFDWDGVTPGAQYVTCAYHVARDADVDFSAASTGVTLQSYLNAADFAARGWNAPRSAVSFGLNGTPPSEAKNWIEQRIIATQPGWSGATQVA